MSTKVAIIEKLKESLACVLPISLIVLLICFFLVPVDTGLMLSFIIGSAMLLGWFIIRAEPAIHVLNKQVEDLSAGAISVRSMGISLSIAIALANGLAMVRVLTGISIFWFLVPGYAVALVLTFFVPQTFTSIAFDSGGVASGPMTATFMLPFTIGVCNATGGTVLHAKGTGALGAKHFLQVSLAEERDVVYIAARSEDKAAIMRAINTSAGRSTPADAICFSLPISMVVGLREDEKEAQA